MSSPRELLSNARWEHGVAIPRVRNRFREVCVGLSTGRQGHRGPRFADNAKSRAPGKATFDALEQKAQSECCRRGFDQSSPKRRGSGVGGFELVFAEKRPLRPAAPAPVYNVAPMC